MKKIVDVFKHNEVSITDIFHQFENTKPYLSSKDFKEILSRYNIDLSYEDIELLFRILADEKDKVSLASLKSRFRKYGLTDFDGYERILYKIKDKFSRKKMTLKQLFQEIDKDKSGNISKEEFRKFLLSLDQEMNDRVVEDIMR
jgi:Ca2+-binding EF-hand superfamily protein